MKPLVTVVALSVFVISTLHTAVVAQLADAPANAISTGELVIEPPTLINLGFEWFVEGDDNRNAAVEVSFRKQAETDWSPALPLLRLQGERIFRTCSPGAFSIWSLTRTIRRGS